MGVIVYFQTASSMGLQAYSQKAANFLQGLLFCSCEIKWLFFPPYGISLAFLNHHVHQFFPYDFLLFILCEYTNGIIFYLSGKSNLSVIVGKCGGCIASSSMNRQNDFGLWFWIVRYWRSISYFWFLGSLSYMSIRHGISSSVNHFLDRLSLFNSENHFLS